MTQSFNPDVMHQMKDLMKRKSVLSWIKQEKIVNEKSIPIDLSRFYYLHAIYTDKSQKIAVIKSAQSGVSTYAIISSLHMGRYLGLNQIHTLPTSSDATTFVQSKTNEIIRNNPCLASKMSKEDTDSVGQKQMGNGFLFYRGTKGKSSGIMITSDRNIYDEYDFSDHEQLGNFQSRLEGADSMKMEVWLSTPTFENFGIDEKFKDSDQKFMRFNCPECGLRQHMDWFKSVDHEEERYQCWECKATINNKMFPVWYAESWSETHNGKTSEGKHADINMQWEARYPGRKISGYWINQMMLPWKSAKELIREYNELRKKGAMQYFFNFKLGMTYSDTERKVEGGLFYKNLQPDKQIVELQSFMGIDVQGNELYCIIGNKQGIYAITVCRDEVDAIGKTIKSKWERAGELMEVYDVQVCVVDATYKPDDVLEFANIYPGRVFMNWYNPAPKGKEIVRYSDIKKFTDKKEQTFAESIKVLSDRERSIDRLIAHLEQGVHPILYTKTDPNLKTLVKHAETMYARVIENKDGTFRREWANTGKNDYFHALIYYEVAMDKKGLFKEEKK